jgi:hypothetical protein
MWVIVVLNEGAPKAIDGLLIMRGAATVIVHAYFLREKKIYMTKSTCTENIHITFQLPRPRVPEILETSI